jgi:hypothetical protein
MILELQPAGGRFYVSSHRVWLAKENLELFHISLEDPPSGPDDPKGPLGSRGIPIESRIQNLEESIKNLALTDPAKATSSFREADRNLLALRRALGNQDQKLFAQRVIALEEELALSKMRFALGLRDEAL